MELCPDATFEDVTYSTKKYVVVLLFCVAKLYGNQVAELSTMIVHLWNLLWILKTSYW